jgi:hypothetical protein
VNPIAAHHDGPGDRAARRFIGMGRVHRSAADRTTMSRPSPDAGCDRIVGQVHRFVGLNGLTNPKTYRC